MLFRSRAIAVGDIPDKPEIIRPGGQKPVYDRKQSSGTVKIAVYLKQYRNARSGGKPAKLPDTLNDGSFRRFFVRNGIVAENADIGDAERG